ncbi:ARFRP1, ADP-ribosylation factor related protein 1 [Monocercomonoides exilis]|uniref:ARFRP1, ADP-ribosylation factor related protein 1 n=1 Tax=Monocercomonoides exilis TaxID=2049356 RepID=UPI00355A9ABD|nr:ARFRP1, ADP-ribosylation factor related protein 1 [Monocercomonoides exilis]|eukprot:MONOS_1569.1-p1 / transcript=MONOS_1569.1 / gene=MONOS_1569 / organism=Monocercomonoides_exilis_PA203 / gene_product=ARFRP1, ADP-ribosylation factor related protein 1 / transcript_product=ARFRP1, ADP-ribosylation factor related protein 1 / location=Mono_scaffold00028:61151-61940(-) / protein_length=195 / sequence_SO=supercontig / SO=protein_coding / is_pseudo=false
MFTLFTGLWQKFTKKAEHTVLILGLDGSGKTSILNQLEQLLFESHSRSAEKPKPALIIPTIGQNSKLVKTKHADVRLLDLGGGATIRNIWKDYYNEANGIIFVVDGTNVERFPEAIAEITMLMHTISTNNIPFLVFFNKHDQLAFIPSSELRNHFEEIRSTAPKIRFQICSAKTGEGLIDGLSWLVFMMEESKT